MKISLTSANLVTFIDAIFSKGKVTVYETYSNYDSELRIFKNTTDILDYIAELQSASGKSGLLSLHYADTKGVVELKKIKLNPEKVQGATFRYTVNGWGLINLHIKAENNSFICYLGVNSEKRADKWKTFYPEMKEPSLWDWKVVSSHHRRLQRVLKKQDSIKK